jgi:hypothetical protein
VNLDDIKIDAEFEALLPALAAESRETLRAAIKSDGKVRDPLVVWQETSILLDGHNRLGIYREEAERTMIDPPRVVLMSFPSRLAAMEWMFDNQAGRRNMTDEDIAYFRGKLYNETKKTPSTRDRDEKTSQFTSSEPSGQNVPVDSGHKTAADIGKKHGNVNEKTVRRDGNYAEALDAIRTVNAKAAADIKSGSLKVPKKEVIALAFSGDIAKAISNLRQHGNWKGKQEAPPEPETPAEPEAKPGVDTQVFKRVMLLEKSYNVLGGHVSWLSANAKAANTKATLQEMDASLTTVFNGIKKLQKQVKA